MDCEKIKEIYMNSCEEFVKCRKDVHDIKCNAIEGIRNQNCILAMEIFEKNCKSKSKKPVDNFAKTYGQK